MKYILTVFLALALISCSENKSTTFSYSGVFKISFPLEQLSDSTIFYSDELAVKTQKGHVVSAKIISNATENLPSDFDIRRYPELVLGINEYSGQMTSLEELFKNTRNEIDYSYGLSGVEVQKTDEVTRYSSCKEKMCLAFVVKNSFSDHILTVHSSGLEKEAFLKLLNGDLYVK